MSSGSDYDSFDEGHLTARGRKSKGKGGIRSSEKGKQKAKDVRPNTPCRHHDPLRLTLRWRLHSRVMPGRPPILALGTPYRKTRLGA